MTAALEAESEALQQSTRRDAFVRHVLRGWWLILILTVSGAVNATYIDSRSGPVYQAQSLVVASKLAIPINSDDFSELGTALFRTDTVLKSIIRSLGLPTTPKDLLSQGYLQSESVPNAVAIRITAAGSSRTSAKDLANAAAESFDNALTEKKMGTFQVFEAAEASKFREAIIVASPVLGGMLGLLVGFLTLAIEFSFRRPLGSPEEVIQLLPAQTLLPCRILIPLIGRMSSVSRRAVILPEGFVGAIREVTGPRLSVPAASGSRVARDEVWDAADDPAWKCCFVVVRGSRPTGAAIGALLARLGVHERFDSLEAGTQMFWVGAQAPGLSDAMSKSNVVIAIVARDSRRRDLEAVAEELLVSRRDPLRLTIFVRVRRTFALRSPQEPPLIKPAAREGTLGFDRIRGQ